MEEKDYSEIYINLKEKTFSIKGNSNFVKESFESIKEIVISLRNTPEEKEEKINDAEIIENKENIIGDGNNKYVQAGIYTLDENKVIFHKRITGKTNAEKMKNVALVAIYAKNGKIQSGELKELCERQSCYDANNFAAIFKRDIENFIVTVGGREKAQEILESMMNKDEI